MDTPVSDPEPNKEDFPVEWTTWKARHDAGDTSVNETSKEGLLARFAHAWRIYRAAPLVEQPLRAGALDRLVDEHENAGGDPVEDAKVAERTKLVDAENQAEADAKAAEDVDTPEPEAENGMTVQTASAQEEQKAVDRGEVAAQTEPAQPVKVEDVLPVVEHQTATEGISHIETGAAVTEPATVSPTDPADSHPSVGEVLAGLNQPAPTDEHPTETA